MRLKRFLNEGKENIINKIPSLTSDQKEKIIDFFKQHRNLENRINWNNWRKLTYDDFFKVMKKAKEQKLKKGNTPISMSGLKEGINGDYVDVTYIFDSYSGRFSGWYAYIPLTYKGSKYIGRHHVGKCVTKWCTASDNEKHWNKYVVVDEAGFIYLVSPDGKDKYAITLYKERSEIELYDKNDNMVEISKGSALGKLISKHKNLFNKYFDIAYENTISVVPYTPDDLRDAYDEYTKYMEDVEYYIDEYIEFIRNYNENFREFQNHSVDTIKHYMDKHELDITEDDEDNLNKLISYIEDIDEMRNSENTPIDDIINTVYEYRYMYKNKDWFINMENEIINGRPEIGEFDDTPPSINNYDDYENVLGVILGRNNFNYIDDELMYEIDENIYDWANFYRSVNMNDIFEKVGIYDPVEKDELWGE